MAGWTGIGDKGCEGHLIYLNDVAGAGLLQVLDGEAVLAIEGQSQAQLIMEETDAALRQVITQPGSR